MSYDPTVNTIIIDRKKSKFGNYTISIMVEDSAGGKLESQMTIEIKERKKLDFLTFEIEEEV